MRASSDRCMNWHFFHFFHCFSMFYYISFAFLSCSWHTAFVSQIQNVAHFASKRLLLERDRCKNSPETASCIIGSRYHQYGDRECHTPAGLPSLISNKLTRKVTRIEQLHGEDPPAAKFPHWDALLPLSRRYPT